MPLGAIAGVVLLVGLAAWGIVLFSRGRAKERATETSSHHESGAGFIRQDTSPGSD